MFKESRRFKAMIEQKLDEKIQRMDKRLKELAQLSQKIERDYQEMMKDLGLTPEELSKYFENRENFTQETWEQMEAEKKILDERLNLELDSLADPGKTKRSLSEKGRIMQHWLFVR